MYTYLVQRCKAHGLGVVLFCREIPQTVLEKRRIGNKDKKTYVLSDSLFPGQTKKHCCRCFVMFPAVGKLGNIFKKTLARTNLTYIVYICIIVLKPFLNLPNRENNVSRAGNI